MVTCCLTAGRSLASGELVSPKLEFAEVVPSLLLSLDDHALRRSSLINLLLWEAPEFVPLDVLHLLRTILSINTIIVTNPDMPNMPQNRRTWSWLEFDGNHLCREVLRNSGKLPRSLRWSHIFADRKESQKCSAWTFEDKLERDNNKILLCAVLEH
jgi:hypothetical protein